MTGLRTLRSVVAAWLTAALVLMGTLVVSGGQESTGLMSQSSRPGDQMAAGERLTTRVCADCHALAVITAQRRTPAAWADIVDAMVNRGAEATALEVSEITRFLTRTRGVVAVNTASAADFVAVLGLSMGAAEAVVAHRTSHGRLGDRDALLEVPGLEGILLEREADALWFD